MFNVQPPPMEALDFAVGAARFVFWLVVAFGVILICGKAYLFFRGVFDRSEP